MGSVRSLTAILHSTIRNEDNHKKATAEDMVFSGGFRFARGSAALFMLFTTLFVRIIIVKKR